MGLQLVFVIYFRKIVTTSIQSRFKNQQLYQATHGTSHSYLCHNLYPWLPVANGFPGIATGFSVAVKWSDLSSLILNEVQWSTGTKPSTIYHQNLCKWLWAAIWAMHPVHAICLITSASTSTFPEYHPWFLSPARLLEHLPFKLYEGTNANQCAHSWFFTTTKKAPFVTASPTNFLNFTPFVFLRYKNYMGILVCVIKQ